MKGGYSEAARHLSEQAYQIFREKGERNAVKVRRVMQITRNLSHGEFESLRILDLGCGEGVYAIEAGIRGAQVVAIDARTQRMANGIKIADELGLRNVRFMQQDVRAISKATLGEFDVIYFLGLLYHLDAPDAFFVLGKVLDMCRDFVIIDTHTSLDGSTKVTHGNVDYFGVRYKEHDESDSLTTKSSRLLSSIDNVYSFWFTKDSLNRLLFETGFTTVLECHVPFEPYKSNEAKNVQFPNDRVTLVATKGPPVKVSSYPWVNELAEEAIAQRLADK